MGLARGHRSISTAHPFFHVKQAVTPSPILAVHELLSLQPHFSLNIEARPTVKARAPVILFTILASLLAPTLIGNVYAISGCNSGCQLTASSNVPSGDGKIWIRIDNNISNSTTGFYCSTHTCIVPLPQSSPPTFTFGNNTIHTLAVLNSTFTGPSTGSHYIWKNWSNWYGTQYPAVWTTNPTLAVGPIIYNYTGQAGFTAVFDR